MNLVFATLFHDMESWKKSWENIFHKCVGSSKTTSRAFYCFLWFANDVNMCQLKLGLVWGSVSMNPVLWALRKLCVLHTASKFCFLHSSSCVMPAESTTSIFRERIWNLFVHKNEPSFSSFHKKTISPNEHSHIIGNAKVDIYFKLKQGVITNFQKHVYLWF